MNRDELIKFLTDYYAPTDLLLWQIVGKSDLVEQGYTITDDKWAEFVEEMQEYLADEFSGNAKDNAFEFFDDEEDN